MKMFTKKETRTDVEKEVDGKIEELSKAAKTSKDVEDVLDLQKKRNELNEKEQFDWAPVIVIAGNITVCLLTLNFEKIDILTTKALSFVIKGRV